LGVLRRALAVATIAIVFFWRRLHAVAAPSRGLKEFFPLRLAVGTPRKKKIKKGLASGWCCSQLYHYMRFGGTQDES
jgi:hypothetical protein